MQDAAEPVLLSEFATEANFEEAAYLRANADVKAAVKDGSCPSGRTHFESFGRREGRRLLWRSRPVIIAAFQNGEGAPVFGVTCATSGAVKRLTI